MSDTTAAREPLLNRTSIASGITLLATGLALVGVKVSDIDQAAVVDAVVAGVGAVGVVAHVVAAYRARRLVTPLADPVDTDGAQLVPVDQISPRQDVDDLDDLTPDPDNDGIDDGIDDEAPAVTTTTTNG